MTAAKNTEAAKAEEKTQAAKAEEQAQAAAPEPAEAATDPAPAEPKIPDGSVEVAVLHEFNDLEAKCRRMVGDRFVCTEKRAEAIIAAHKPALVTVVGGGADE